MGGDLNISWGLLSHSHAPPLLLLILPAAAAAAVDLNAPSLRDPRQSQILSSSVSLAGWRLTRARPMPPPMPKSPPTYPDLCGRRRLQLEIQMLTREVGFLEEELQSLEGVHPVSGCCKEVTDFVGAHPDPSVPMNKKKRKPCRIWNWIRSKLCFSVSSICCCAGCSLMVGSLSCTCPHLACRCCCCCQNVRPSCSSTSCCKPRCCCPKAPDWRYWCCCWNNCCKISSCCCFDVSCCRQQCACPTISCPEYSCGCICSCPRFRKVQLCPTCIRACCTNGCEC